ncbi:hypothetical protein MRB53_014613 [Persea americana]|uniref:Uncharacterized protein n=1 Tax=Persea americana TaxID=3435 RepID=A0ACC2KBP5_PERAE|nr:hypothetical protein MRB53_014613 [Persea americana]
MVMMMLSDWTQDLNESRFELLTWIQQLKPELQNWRSKFDPQFKVYCNEWLSILMQNKQSQKQKEQLSKANLQ